MSDLSKLTANTRVVELACALPEKTHRKLLTVAVESTIRDLQFYKFYKVQRLSQVCKLDISSMLDIIHLYITLVEAFMQSEERQFYDALWRLGFTQAFIDKCPLRQNSYPVSLILTGNDEGFQKLSSFNWRVDISFMFCVSTRGPVPPRIIVNLQASDGQLYIFEVDLNTFHRLRFNIALAFKEFNFLKRSNVLKNIISI